MGVVSTVNRRLLRELGTLGGVASPEMLAAAKALKRSLRKTLGVKGHGKPSAPGEPPRKQSGKTQKSVISGAVGTAQRVAVTRFTGPLQEFGVDTAVDARAGKVRSRRNLFTGQEREVLQESAERQRRRQRAQLRGQKAYKLKIEPRPFMQKALAAARDAMVDVTVSEIRRRLPSA